MVFSNNVDNNKTVENEQQLCRMIKLKSYEKMIW